MCKIQFLLKFESEAKKMAVCSLEILLPCFYFCLIHVNKSGALNVDITLGLNYNLQYVICMYVIYQYTHTSWHACGFFPHKVEGIAL